MKNLEEFRILDEFCEELTEREMFLGKFSTANKRSLV